MQKKTPHPKKPNHTPSPETACSAVQKSFMFINYPFRKLMNHFGHCWFTCLKSMWLTLL